MLSRLLSLPMEADSLDGTVTGEAESKQFIHRLLPGNVEGCEAYGTPVAAHHWRTQCFGGDPAPYVEVARKQPLDDAGDDCLDGMEESITKDYRPNRMSPLTTKAGGRLWSISFAAPSTAAEQPEDAVGTEVRTLRASYPMQLLVRFDAGRQNLCYDVFEFEPTLPSVSKAAFASTPPTSDWNPP